MSSHLRTNGDESKRNGETWLQPEASAQSHGFLADASLSDIARILYRHRRPTLLFLASVMAATVLYVLVVPRQYRSEAKLFVRIGRENVGLDATTTLGQGSPVTSLPVSREEEINTVVAILESRNLAEKVVDSIGPATILDPTTNPLHESNDSNGKTTPVAENGEASSSVLRPIWAVLEHLGLKSPLSLREKAVVALRKRLGIEATKKSNVIVLSHEGPSPKVSQQIVSKLVDYYLDEHVRMNRTPRAHQFLKEQATALRTKLTAQEDQLRTVKNSTGLASPAEQRQSLVLRMGRLQDDLKTSEATAAATAAEIKEIDKRLEEMKPTEVLQSATGFPNIAGDGMRQQLYALQLKEKDLASRMTDEHPELKFVRQQIANAKKIVDAQDPSRTQTTVGPNRKYDELRLTQLKDQAQLASLRARGTALETQLADARQEMQALNGAEMRIGQIQRDVQILEGNYRKYADSLEQARIDESLERERISNINVAEAPTLNHDPIRPKALLTLVIGFALGLFGGLCVALALEFFDHSLKTSDEIEQRLSLPVLTSIPQINGRQLVARM